jgi:phosphonate transport system substrate-binding protein
LALPPSVGQNLKTSHIAQLKDFLSRAVGRDAEVVVANSYRELTTFCQGAKVDVAWAPPFVAARLESSGLKILLRGVRRGRSTYRAALLATSPDASISWLKGRKAAWVDPYSVAGYLLPLVYLKANGVNPDRDLMAQDFAGSYIAAIDRVVSGRADVTSVFAPPSEAGLGARTGLDELAPHLVPGLRAFAFTEEVPNSGLVATARMEPPVMRMLTGALKSLRGTPEGAPLLEQMFQMDDFEDAPKVGYHALYRLAVASL